MNETKQTARERINTLFCLAKENIRENPKLAQRYATIARRISMTAKVTLSTEQKHQICKHCKQFILPGVNCKFRTQQRREPHIVVTCLLCGGITRFPLRPRRKNKHDNTKRKT
ncbi:MAG: ribonuclease P protein component 4 [Candidatus Bathyarchaeia archaeon]|nr:ribonuclease P [Candidatus Bathyarchaeota archaeon A05DMB-4]MDH7595351.1 ribonuclease P [Candidatus Bathyarchaeota archaeon]